MPRPPPGHFCYLLHFLVHSPDALQVLPQVSKQLGLAHAFTHLLHRFIFELQQGVLAKDILHIVKSITVVMKRIFFMILI
jgi:hypothetical protein